MKIHHVTTLLQVFDMPRSVAFYRDVLGFTIVSQSEDGENFHWALLKLGEAALMLNTAYEEDERPVAPEPARLTAHGDTVLYFSCNNVHEVYEHLSKLGWEAQRPQQAEYGMWQVYTTDPDGFQLCFQHPV